MGLDYGAKTVGVAISDSLFLTAQAVEVIRRGREDKERRTLARIEELICEYGVSKIVLGMPRHMDGRMGERAIKTLAFKEKLERRSGLEVILVDEQLTTAEAMEKMNEAGTPRAKQKGYVDMVAAALILEEYMRNENNNV